MTFEINQAVANACRHVTTIARLKYNGLERNLLPAAAADTATVSFIKINGKTYAFTAWHVIEAFKKQATQDGKGFEGYSCVQAPGVAILGPFLRPPPQYPNPEPDIAICPINADLPGYIKKVPFEVLPKGDPQWPVTHAIAVGFPTVAKEDVTDRFGNIILKLPCVHAVAEGLGATGLSDQIQFHSEISEKPSLVSLSGMSGGLVFWSDGKAHGLIGFVKEALDVSPKGGEETFYAEPKVNFVCQRVDFRTLTEWTEYVDANWTNERAKISAELKNKQVDENGEG